jgi:hypothetical protein
MPVKSFTARNKIILKKVNEKPSKNVSLVVEAHIGRFLLLCLEVVAREEQKARENPPRY